MQTYSAPAKRTQYPFSVALILVVHLALGYMIYQKVAKPNHQNDPELKAIAAPVATASIP